MPNAELEDPIGNETANDPTDKFQDFLHFSLLYPKIGVINRTEVHLHIRHNLWDVLPNFI